MAELGTLPLILTAAALYGAGVVRAWDRAGRGRLIPAARVACFATGVIALLIALDSPLDAAAAHSLTMHMAQHVILITVAAPLIVVGAPMTAFAHAFSMTPSTLPRWMRPLAQPRRHAAMTWALWTAGALLLHVVVVAAWHLPAAYDAALTNPALHASEHASFFFTAALLWWAALGMGHRSQRGGGVVVLFLATLPANALGLLMTVASTPWYPAYNRGGLAARLADQQLAGVVMWGFGGLATLIGAFALFVSWLDAFDRTTPGRGPVTNAPGAIVSRTGAS